MDLLSLFYIILNGGPFVFHMLYVNDLNSNITSSETLITNTTLAYYPLLMLPIYISSSHGA